MATNLSRFGATAGAGPDPRAAVATLAERYWGFVCREFPVTAINAGETTPDAVLFREAPADFARRNDQAATMLADLSAIEETALSGQDWATYQLLRRELEEIRAFDAVRAHERPSVFPLGPDFVAVYFANTVSIGNAADARLYVDRIAGVPEYLGDVIANLTGGVDAGIRYPRLVLDNAAATVRGLMSGPVESQPWFGPFVRSAVSAQPAVQEEATRARALIESSIVPALGAYAEFLEGPLKRHARDSIACTDAREGREFYMTLVRHFTSTTQTPDEIHALGLAEIERISGEMETVAAQAGFSGNLAGYREHLRTDQSLIAPSAEALRERIEVLSKRIEKRLPAWFGRLPRITYGVESIPEAVADRMPPAYAQPNPADRSGPGIHWVTSIPAKCPSFMHVPLALHEAWPGHLMHLALIQEMEALPKFRRHGALGYSMCLEGWALYCEALGVEMGLYETPAQHYGRLDMEIWRALRLVVDTGIHWLGWSRELAIETMLKHQALPRSTIEAEVDRYISLPAQALAYQIGHLKMRELRKKAENDLGAKFSVRAFHDQIMAAGPVTLPVLERLIGDWMLGVS
jgi:uncharacterized protein (DUF885 family)